MKIQWLPILWATLATLGYGVFLHAPKRVLVSVSMVGGFGYFIYSVMNVVSEDVIFSTFIAACCVGYISEVLARVKKSPAIVWVIPGILPLAPGYGLYKTMEYFINNQYDLALEKGLTALMIAGAISLGVIMITTSYRVLSNTVSMKYRKDISQNDVDMKQV